MLRRPRDVSHQDLLISWNKTTLLILNFLPGLGSISPSHQRLQLEVITLIPWQLYLSWACRSLIAFHVVLYPLCLMYLFTSVSPSVLFTLIHSRDSPNVYWNWVEQGRKGEGTRGSGQPFTLVNHFQLFSLVPRGLTFISVPGLHISIALMDSLAVQKLCNWNVDGNLSKIINKGDQKKPPWSSPVFYFF